MSSNGRRFLFREIPKLTVEASDDLALDWSNTLFVVGISLAVFATAFLVYPYVRARLSASSQEK